MFLSFIHMSSQSIIPHSHEYGLRSTEENPGILMNIVEVYLRPTKRGRRDRPVTKCGRVTEIKTNEPNRVKTDTCPGKCQNTRFRSITDCFYCIVLVEIIFLT